MGQPAIGEHEDEQQRDEAEQADLDIPGDLAPGVGTSPFCSNRRLASHFLTRRWPRCNSQMRPKKIRLTTTAKPTALSK